MKKIKSILVFLIVLLFTAAPVFADVNWHLANQTTVGWDAVTTLSDGTTVPSEQVSYKVYIAKLVDKTDMVEVGNAIVDVEFTVTLNSEGKWFVGVKAVRTIDGVNIDSSRIAWSDMPLDCENGTTFGIMLYLGPANVTGLRITQ